MIQAAVRKGVPALHSGYSAEIMPSLLSSILSTDSKRAACWQWTAAGSNPGREWGSSV